MKRILATIAISFVTTLLTLGGVPWGLYYYPVPLSTQSLADGTVQHDNSHCFAEFWNGRLPPKVDYQCGTRSIT